MKLPRIYPITDRRISGLSHAEQVERLIAGGATLVQLREKVLPPSEFYADARAALELARHHGVNIIINDRVDIAVALGADGVHLGQEDLPPAEARRILGDNAIIGFSTHTLEQVRAALRMPVDYIAFGPVFPTQTKERPDSVVGLDLLGEVRQVVGNKPLVAIGGITAANIEAVSDAGADSAAMISQLLSEPDQITATYSNMINIVVKR